MLETSKAVAILLILVALLTTVIVGQESVLWWSRASDLGVDDVIVHNRSPSSFSVFWLAKSKNSFLWGEKDLDRVSEVEEMGRLKKVTVVGLAESTKYKFKILPGEKIYEVETRSGGLSEIKNIEVEKGRYGEGMYFIKKLGGSFLGVYANEEPVFNNANLFGEGIGEGDIVEMFFYDQAGKKSAEFVARDVKNGIVLTKPNKLMIGDTQELEDVVLKVSMKMGRLGSCAKNGKVWVTIEGVNGDKREYINTSWGYLEGGLNSVFDLDLAGFGRQAFDLRLKVPKYLGKKISVNKWEDTLEVGDIYTLVGDVNDDNIIDGIDFARVKGEALKFKQVQTGDYLVEDLDGSCQVNNVDLGLLVRSLQLIAEKD